MKKLIPIGSDSFGNDIFIFKIVLIFSMKKSEYLNIPRIKIFNIIDIIKYIFFEIYLALMLKGNLLETILSLKLYIPVLPMHKILN